ncbi:MAG TPA: hypothetical protein DEF42_08605 [Desulfosporosinus sp.]|nr:hypothetical protein [Desulfosporosinus sp.]
MSVFTVVIIIWVIYQLGISLIKKGKQQAPRRFSDPLNLPDLRSIRETLQETPQGSWREQIQQALNSSRQAEEAEPLKSIPQRGFTEDYLQKEGAQGTGVNLGVNEVNTYRKMDEVEEYRDSEGDFSQRIAGAVQEDNKFKLAMTEKELVRGVVWAEILGKPRAMSPFRGPRH